MLDKLNYKLSNLNEYLTLKNIALGTAALVAVVCTWKKCKVMWLRNETKKMAAGGQQQLALPNTSGMGSAMVVGPSPSMHMYAELMKHQQTQVPQRVPQTTTPPVRMPEATGWETNALHQHIEKLRAENRKLKAQAEGFPTMSMPDSVDDRGNPLYFED